MGPLSLAQLEMYQRQAEWIHRQRGEVVDAYDIGVQSVAEHGVYPTFGHIDCTHRRWYRDVWGPRTPETEIGILCVPRGFHAAD